VPSELYGPAGALAALAFVVVALMRGDLVPGWVYKLERSQREKAETQAERNADSIALLARAADDAHSALRQPGPPGHA
jgi:hypothetical protein